MGEAADHIASWEAAGLIDQELAAKLRAAVLVDADRTMGGQAATPAALFGPSVHVTEVFAYLGVIFLLAAWTTFITQQAPLTTEPALVAALGVGAAGVAFALFGGFLRRGDARRRRGAGWAWLVATVYLGAMAFLFGSWLFRPDEELVLVVGAIIAVAAAVAFRVWLPSVLTQVGLLASLTTLAAALLLWARAIVFPDSLDGSPVTGGGPDAVVMVVLEAGWWLAWAAALGIIGLREAGAADPAADRRAAVTRLWAGFTAVLGVASAVTRSSVGPNDEFGRVLEPWVADLAIAIVSAVLIERAFRRGSGAFLVAGAFGLIIALSDFNASYLTDTVATGLLVEGVILLAIGFGAGRLRGRLRRPEGDRTPDAIGAMAVSTGSGSATPEDSEDSDTRITGG